MRNIVLNNDIELMEIDDQLHITCSNSWFSVSKNCLNLKVYVEHDKSAKEWGTQVFFDVLEVRYFITILYSEWSTVHSFLKTIGVRV